MSGGRWRRRSGPAEASAGRANVGPEAAPAAAAPAVGPGSWTGRPGRRVPTRSSSCGSARPLGCGSVSGAAGWLRFRCGRIGLVRRVGRRASLPCHRSRRAPCPRLVLRTVLAWIRVLLRVERPVRAARRPVPARTTPVGLERALDAVVRGRAERGLVALPTAPIRAAACPLAPASVPEPAVAATCAGTACACPPVAPVARTAHPARPDRVGPGRGRRAGLRGPSPSRSPRPARPPHDPARHPPTTVPPAPVDPGADHRARPPYARFVASLRSGSASHDFRGPAGPRGASAAGRSPASCS